MADSGTVPDAWTFSDPNYQSASGSATVSITPATAVVTVTPYSVTYDGNQHEATVVATGVGTDGDLSGSVDLSGTAHTDAGNYATDPWSFSNPNYVSQSGTVSDCIGQATATISVGYSGVYDAYAHGLSGTATGVGGITLPAGDLTIIATTYTNVADSGTVPDAWTFSNPNYQSASGSATVSITPATAVVTVTPYSVTYDGNQHEATVVATGVGTDTDLSGSVDLSGTAHSDAGTYASDPWSFSNPNYVSQSGTVSDCIGQATATISVGYSGVYDSYAHGLSGTATGVGGITLPAGDLTIIATTYTNVADSGTVPDAWTFSDPNYQSASGSATVSITPATAVVTVTRYSVTYDAQQYEATVVATGVGADTDLSGSVDLSGTAHSDAGTYASDPWSFSNPNYVSQSGTVSDSIGQATATISVGYSGVYDSYAHGLSGTATGVGGVTLPAGDLTIIATTYTNVADSGTVPDAWTFSDPNYQSASGSATVSITPATAVVTVTGYSVAYDGLPHGISSGTATGVGGAAISGLAIDCTSYTDVPGGTVAWISSNPDYMSQSGSATVTITQVGSTITVLASDTTYDAAPQGATASWASNGADGGGGPLTVTYAGIDGTTYGPSTTAPTQAGQYAASASFVGDTDHTGSSDTADYTIAQTTAASENWSGGTGTNGQTNNWSVADNWQGGTVPDGPTTSVGFGSAGATGTVVLDSGNRTVGAIVFGSGTATTITTTAEDGGTLTLDNGANPATVNVSGSGHSIASPVGVILNSSAVITANNSGDSLAIAGNISDGGNGAEGITKSGLGTLILSGANTYQGATVVAGGVLDVTSPSALPDGGSLIVGADAGSIFGASQAASGLSSAGNAAAGVVADTAVPAAVVPAVFPFVHGQVENLADGPVAAHVAKNVPAAAVSSAASDAVFASQRSALDPTVSPADHSQPARPWAWLAVIESSRNSSVQNETTDFTVAALDKVLARFGV